MTAPLLSVITICRNAREPLERTAASVLAQPVAVEYWIVDGDSTDGTAETLGRLAARGVRVLSEPDGGIADAMNKGVRLASGEWVAHLHAGDEYLPGALSLVAERAARTEADVLCGWIRKQEPGGETLFRADPERLGAEMTVNHPATFTRRSCFQRFGNFDPRWPNAMDYEFFLRLKAAGARFEVVPAALARMAWGGQSELSLRATLGETHRIRRLHSRSAWHRSLAYHGWALARAHTRLALQRAGLGGLVAAYRRRLSWPPKGGGDDSWSRH